NQKPGGNRGVEAAGDQQDRTAAGKSKCGRFARRYGDAMHLDASKARQSLHSRVVPSAAGAADGNDGIVRLSFDSSFKSKVALIGDRGTGVENRSDENAGHRTKGARKLRAGNDRDARI